MFHGYLEDLRLPHIPDTSVYTPTYLEYWLVLRISDQKFKVDISIQLTAIYV